MMTNYLYWFDCDLSLVHDRNWLESVVTAAALVVDCQPMHAAAPDWREVGTWLDLFGKFRPTRNSVFLMHGRTGRVDETLEALWKSSGSNGEELPQCRVVYSGGRDWDHLDDMSFDNLERYCTVKANDFKWSAEEALPANLKENVGAKFAEILLKYVAETKSPTQRLRSMLAGAGSRVYEASLIAAAGTMSGEITSVDARRVLQWIRFGPLLLKSQQEWSGTPQYDQLDKIKEALNAAYNLIQFQNDRFEVAPEALYNSLFNGDARGLSLYGLIRELDASLQDA